MVEVLVAFALLTVLMAAVAMTLVQSMDLTRQTRWRAVAANTATAEMEALRLVDPRSVPVGTEIATRSTSLGDVEVARTAEWIPADATGDACQSPTDSPRDLLRVTVEVSWPNGSYPSSTSQTVLTPDVGTADVDRGHVAVRLLDRDARPPATRPLVRVSGGPGNAQRTGMVSSDGCLFVDHLEPGDYTVEVLAGGVDEQGGPPVVETVVQPAAATPVQVTYDDASTLQVAFTTVVAAAMPAGIDTVVRNTGLLPDERRDEPGTGATRTVGPLFPFAGGYEVFAGVAECEGVDPAAVGGTRVLADMVPGATTAVQVPLATVRLRTANNGGNPVGGVRLRARTGGADDGGCPGGAELVLGRTGAPNELVVGVPLGTWSFRAQGNGGTPVGPIVLDDPTTVVDVEVRVGG